MAELGLERRGQHRDGLTQERRLERPGGADRNPPPGDMCPGAIGPRQVSGPR